VRLTHIKLAGFKSFAEPTHIPVPGQLVGVVGPNGCGKSNVIDAVRWVLGESQARHLRGETMQDVIFSGSAERKAMSRASVELIFDNSMGRAAGQWSQYGEISVKRVLQRDGESSYYLNNSHVRRRDVQDIFLGTGLGPRAYAIIEQGMISRIIESRPEDLRVFLEEAAGISRYKERRRETELRLADSRSNLARTDDIRRELEVQIEHLQAQSLLARRYEDLHEQLRTTQNLHSLAKVRDARAGGERFRRERERVSNDLEAETASLRDAEKRLAQTRQDHYAAGDLQHTAQGELYAANAEAARLETQLQFVRDNRRRLEGQLTGLMAEMVELELKGEEAQRGLAQSRSELEKAGELVRDSHTGMVEERERLPQVEGRFHELQAQLAELQRQSGLLEQRQGVAQTKRDNAVRLLNQLRERRERLEEEKRQLVCPSPAALQQSQASLRDMEVQLEILEQHAASLQTRLPFIEQNRTAYAHSLEAATRPFAKCEAQVEALLFLQSGVASDETVHAFLARHGWEKLPRLWQSIQVAPGWEDAVESVLGMRLNALPIGGWQSLAAWSESAPPGGVTLYRQDEGGDSVRPALVADLVPLRRHVAVRDAGAHGVLDDWLQEVYAIESWQQGIVRASELPPGALLVSREGHLIVRHTVSFFAPPAQIHGALARMREIEELQTQREVLQQQVLERSAALAEFESALRHNQEQSAQLRAQASEVQSRYHHWQMEAMRLAQLAERFRHRSEQIEAELGEIASHFEVETATLAECSAQLQSQSGDLAKLAEQIEETRTQFDIAAENLQTQRKAVQATERAAQEAGFLEKSSRGKIEALNSAAEGFLARLAVSASNRQIVQAELDSLLEEPHAVRLQQALGQRQSREQALTQSRTALEDAAAQLVECEQGKLEAEQKLDPLRERINELKLKEQEARLVEQQAAEQLAANRGVEEELIPLLEKATRAGALQGEINRLGAEIEALGAVNLAALAELESAQQRKVYLDLQSADLTEAVATLEAAVRRIDRETRIQLQDTFDKVNQGFSAMFPQLFGGGQASIALTGEEILDAGVLVIAQPPGKKTSSIHLLSGGEKALTAIALVFSLFQLNPAPFCLLDEVDAPLDDSNCERFCGLVKKMSEQTQFLFISHNKISMEMAGQLIGITMQESGVSRMVAVDISEAMRLTEAAA
jgi:chromosome segregation protein